MPGKLNIGVIGPSFPPLENIARVAMRLEEKGYDSIWFADHLMGWFPHSIWKEEYVGKLATYSPHTFYETTLSMAIAASFTKRIRVGSSVVEPNRRHPAMIAKSFATLENIAPGRIILGIGVGEAENIVPYGISYNKTLKKLEEAIRIIKILWSSNGYELLSFNGEIFKLDRAVFSLPPKQGRPPIWIGGRSKKACKLVASLGDGWLPWGVTLNEYKQKMDMIKEEARRLSRDPANIEFAAYFTLLIDPNRDECYRLMEKPIIKALALVAPSEVYEEMGLEHPLGKDFSPIKDYIPAWYSENEILDAIKKVPREVVEKVLLWGNVDDVIDKLEVFRKTGMQSVALWNVSFFPEPDKTRSSYQCIDKIVEYYKESNS